MQRKRGGGGGRDGGEQHRAATTERPQACRTVGGPAAAESKIVDGGGLRTDEASVNTGSVYIHTHLLYTLNTQTSAAGWRTELYIHCCILDFDSIGRACLLGRPVEFPCLAIWALLVMPSWSCAVHAPPPSPGSSRLHGHAATAPATSAVGGALPTRGGHAGTKISSRPV